MSKLEHFQLFETASMMYLAGSDSLQVSRAKDPDPLTRNPEPLTYPACPKAL